MLKNVMIGESSWYSIGTWQTDGHTDVQRDGQNCYVAGEHALNSKRVDSRRWLMCYWATTFLWTVGEGYCSCQCVAAGRWMSCPSSVRKDVSQGRVTLVSSRYCLDWWLAWELESRLCVRCRDLTLTLAMIVVNKSLPSLCQNNWLFSAQCTVIRRMTTKFYCSFLRNSKTMNIWSWS